MGCVASSAARMPRPLSTMASAVALSSAFVYSDRYLCTLMIDYLKVSIGGSDDEMLIRGRLDGKRMISLYPIFQLK